MMLNVLEFGRKSEKPAGCAPRASRNLEVDGCYELIRISKNSGPQAHIGIRMAIHMFWREKFIT